MKQPPIILLTGTPGTGKSTVAKALGKKLHAKVLSEKEFCQKAKVATWNAKLKEWEIDPKKYARAFSVFVKIFHAEFPSKTLIIEGHVGCEIRLPVSYAVVLRCNPIELGYRLAKRKYSELKIQENIFCEEMDFCLNEAKKHYSKTKKSPLQVDTSTRSPAQAVQHIQKWLR